MGNSIISKHDEFQGGRILKTESIEKVLGKYGPVKTEFETDDIWISVEHEKATICVRQARAISGKPLHIKNVWMGNLPTMPVKLHPPTLTALKEILRATLE